MTKVVKLAHDKTLLNSRLEFKISGKDIDYVIVNTLRRIILSEVAVLSFDYIEINENTSVFNNNQIKLNIQNIPVIGVPNVPLTYKKDKIVEDEAEEDEDLLLEINEGEFYSETEPFSINSLDQLTMFVDYHNTTKEIVSVTTDDAKFYYQAKEIKSPYPNPVILIKLQPEQKIKFSTKTKLTNEKEDGKNTAVSICAYNEIKDNEFKFFLESRGLFSEKEILNRSCKILIKKLKKIVKLFPEIDMKDGEIKIPKGTHTIGNLLAHGLELLPETKYATYYQRHILDNEIIIKFGFDKEYNLKKMIIKVVKKYIQIYENLDKLFTKL